MKKTFLFALVLLLSVSPFGCVNRGNEAQPEEGQPKERPRQTGESDETAIRSLVEEFGSRLQTVSLQAPKDIVSKSIQENYGDFVSPALLAEWLSDPLNAPGRVLSSPWPDRIEILTVEKLTEYTYEVKGEIIEVTSAEKASGEVAASRPITLVVKKIGSSWLIDAAILGAYEEAKSIVYSNTQYGFIFSLPESWKGYSIITSEWEGRAIGGSQSGETVETGPKISIRHPQWTSENRRQDIPIMIFTLTQWNALQQGEFLVSPAPVGPTELGRNTRYVFALPARYNYAFPPGYEEVEKILEANPLRTNEDYSDD